MNPTDQENCFEAEARKWLPVLAGAGGVRIITSRRPLIGSVVQATFRPAWVASEAKCRHQW